MRVEEPLQSRSSRAKSRGAGTESSQTPLDCARDERIFLDVAKALRASADCLAVVSETARLDAELLMAHALGTSHDDVLLTLMEAEAPPSFDALIDRRLAHEPVAYITGRKAFWTIELAVGPGVLIPRPDSESLLEAAVAHFGECGPKRILDLGTGPGTLLLAALDQWPQATGIGVDASEEALVYARRNAIPRAEFRRSDWGEGLHERFDLILCNPPYVETGAPLPPDIARYEPEIALYAGPDGLGAYRVLAAQVGRLLAPGGLACFEVGAGQASEARALFAAQGFATGSRHDLNGVERCLVLRG